MSEEHKNEPRFFSPLWNAKPQTRRSLLSRVYSVNQISQLQFFIAISHLFSCESTPKFLAVVCYLWMLVFNTCTCKSVLCPSPNCQIRVRVKIKIKVRVTSPVVHIFNISLSSKTWKQTNVNRVEKARHGTAAIAWTRAWLRVTSHDFWVRVQVKVRRTGLESESSKNGLESESLLKSHSTDVNILISHCFN